MFRILLILILFTFPIKADQNDLRLEILFKKLLETSDENEINNITVNIWDIWYETNDPNINHDF